MRRLLPFVVALLVVAGLALVYGLQYATLPLDQDGRLRTIRILPGQSFAQVAASLKTQGIIQDEHGFRWLGRATGLARQVKAGEFRVHTGWSRLRLLQALVEGQPVLHRLQIPEGLAWWETARLVARAGLAGLEAFKAAVHDPEILAASGLPLNSAEGFLFPETYRLPKAAQQPAEAVARALMSEFFRQTRELWPQGPPPVQRLVQIVTLASLVEKETAVAEERKRIAGVFVNRLERGMRLQCDPTVIYGLGPGFDGNLTKADLRDSSNPYNTYRHSGLPPGPICSPGLDSIRAALNPEDHTYLYFVARKDGRHHFSRSLAEHNRAVRTHQLQ